MRADPAYIRDDYRGIAARIRAESRAGDAILLSAPNQWEVFTYYYGRQPGDDLPVHPAPYRPTEIEAAAWVRDIVGQQTGGQLVALYWGDTESDPQRHIERALATQAFKAGERWITTVRVATYGIGPAIPGTTQSHDVTLGDDIRLMGAGLPNTAWHPGDIVPLTLLWEPRHDAGRAPQGLCPPRRRRRRPRRPERLGAPRRLRPHHHLEARRARRRPLRRGAARATWCPANTPSSSGHVHPSPATASPSRKKAPPIGDALPLHTLTVLPPP